MKIGDIKAAAEKGNLRYEINVIDTFSDGSKQMEIGVRYMNNSKGYIWAWWKYWDDEIVRGIPADEEYGLFRGTYNQNCGTQNKTFKRGRAVERQLQRILEK